MKNRRLPFGYKMEMGELTPHTEEANLVCWIFGQYGEGMAYNSLVDKLNGQPTVTKGKQDFYLHPMNFSGVIQEESIPELEALMRGAHSFQCYATDRYEEYLDMSDSEYLEYLESRREEIVSSLLDECRTPRCNLFKAGPIAETIATRFSLHRLCDKQNTNSHANRFVSEVMEQLVAEGRLVTAHTRQGEGVRTATAKELGEQCHKPTEQTEGQMSMTM